MQQTDSLRVFYRPPPSSKDTRHIWDEAGLPEVANEIAIRIALDSWIIWHAYVYKKELDGEFHIQWVNPNGYIIKTLYDTFIRWIMVSCAIPPKEPINLTA